MQAFTSLEALVAPLDRSDVDTDALIPKQFLKSISRTGFGPFLFDDWRYLDRGDLGQDCSQRALNPEFVLNQPRYAGCQILLTRANFGCGSSREHAVWALAEYGFRIVIASSFADIFYGNCLKNGLLPVVLDASEIDSEFNAVQTIPNYRMQVDLPTQTLVTARGQIFHFDIDPHRKHCLLEGLDDIELTLQAAQQIRFYEQVRRSQEPWLFDSGVSHA
jgi:3-isopropylmalate/(R)-2-methylmalate dehydratase small subunit